MDNPYCSAHLGDHREGDEIGLVVGVPVVLDASRVLRSLPEKKGYNIYIYTYI